VPFAGFAPIFSGEGETPMVMNVALSLTTLGFAIVMAIPLVGPMLF
jgi:hypothetical protein